MKKERKKERKKKGHKERKLQIEYTIMRKVFGNLK